MNAKSIVLGLVAVVLAMGMSLSSALAAASCTGALKMTGGEKVATVTCSYDVATNPPDPALKPSYACKATWKLKNVKNVDGTLEFNFNVNRGDSNTWKYDNGRVAGEKIKEEVSKLSYTCT